MNHCICIAFENMCDYSFQKGDIGGAHKTIRNKHREKCKNKIKSKFCILTIIGNVLRIKGFKSILIS